MTTSSLTPSGGGVGAESGPASHVRAVLFDLDGTLIDSIGLILASFRYATSTVLGEAVPDDVMLRDIGTPLWKQMADISPDDVDELVREYRVHNNAHHDEMVTGYPGTAETLSELKRMGYPVGVVTSKLNAGALRGLRLFELDGFVDLVVGADDVTVHKPDPYPLRHAARLLGVPLEECMYVGDSPHDMAAAVSGGAVAAAAFWGPFDHGLLLAEHPDYVLDSISDILPLLQGDARRFDSGASSRGREGVE